MNELKSLIAWNVLVGCRLRSRVLKDHGKDDNDNVDDRDILDCERAKTLC